jgi:YHS domain-containing protein
VRGFPLHMPSYDGLLSDAELDGLTGYVLSLPPEPGAGSGAAAAAVEVAVDPVCHMHVRVTDDALHLPAPDGGSAYFCSETCRDRYAAHPELF